MKFTSWVMNDVLSMKPHDTSCNTNSCSALSLQLAVQTSARLLMSCTNKGTRQKKNASLIPFFRLLYPENCFYRWNWRQNDVYMKKVPWFFKLKFWAGGQAGLWQETPHHGDSAPSWTQSLCTCNYHHFKLLVKISYINIRSYFCKIMSLWLEGSYFYKWK